MQEVVKLRNQLTKTMNKKLESEGEDPLEVMGQLAIPDESQVCF